VRKIKNPPRFPRVLLLCIIVAVSLMMVACSETGTSEAENQPTTQALDTLNEDMDKGATDEEKATEEEKAAEKEKAEKDKKAATDKKNEKSDSAAQKTATAKKTDSAASSDKSKQNSSKTNNNSSTNKNNNTNNNTNKNNSSNNSGSSAKGIVVSGSGVTDSKTFTLSDLKNSGQAATYKYFSRGKDPKTETHSFQGVKLTYLLNKAGLKSSASKVTVTATDGFSKTFTIAEVKEMRMDETDAGNLLPMLIAYQENGKALSGSYPFRLVTGQQCEGDYNRQYWVQNVCKIDVK
jgi:hypothetical protein